jgi:hypothetical protein
MAANDEVEDEGVQKGCVSDKINVGEEFIIRLGDQAHKQPLKRVHQATVTGKRAGCYRCGLLTFGI